MVFVNQKPLSRADRAPGDLKKPFIFLLGFRHWRLLSDMAFSKT